MKNLSKISFSLLFLATAVSLLTSCHKSVMGPAKNSITGKGLLNSTAFVHYQAIVIAATHGDTVYAVGTCAPGSKADSVAFSTLPAMVAAYLTANYAGYTFTNAYKIFNAANVAQGYVVNIIFNSNPVGLKFDATGVFVKVLEQRQSQDLEGQGWHEGGLFGDRDGRHNDTIALTALPAAIKTYFTTNYPKDTLKHALINRDSSYVVVSADAGIFVTEFTSTGTFIKRVPIYPHMVTTVLLTQAALPANISTYLTATYPAYVFDAAFEVKLNGAITGYAVVIDANTTKYLVIFDGGGNFFQSLTVR